MKLKLKHILVSQKYEAEDIERLLKRGETFEDLAKRFSICPSAKAGGDLGEIDTRALDRDFADAAQTLKPGVVSRIVRTKFGYHLIQRLA